MKKILISDSGSTKTDWVSITQSDANLLETATYTGCGLNPVFLDESEIKKELGHIAGHLGGSFDEIRFFGAGVGNTPMKEKMLHCLDLIFECPDIIVDTDIAGAAKAVLGDKAGIACIMGTGSNSCHYNGMNVDRTIPSLGFILDDNGGGVAFGKRLVSDIFKGIAPEEICIDFNERFNLTVEEVLNHIYRCPAPNRWLAGFMPFILEHKTHPYIASMIAIQIELFFNRELRRYPETELTGEGIGFVGSVASQLSAEIISNASARGWKVRDIIAKPIDALIDKTIKNHND